MAFPVGYEVSTTNLESGSGNPAQARSDLLLLTQVVNQITASADQPMGIPMLDSAGMLNESQLPANYVTSGTINLEPGSGFVKINDILRLQVIPSDELLAYPDVVIGDLALYADDLTGANAGLAIFDGTDWRILGVLADLTALT